MKKKKIFLLPLAAIIMLFAFVACGGSSNQEDEGVTPPAEETQAEEDQYYEYPYQPEEQVYEEDDLSYTPIEEAPSASSDDILDVLSFYSDLLEMQMEVSLGLSFSTDLSNFAERMAALEEITDLITTTDYMSIASMRVKANSLADIAARFGIDVDAFAHLL